MDNRSVEIDEVLKATEETNDFPHHQKVQNSYKSAKVLLKKQFSNLKSIRDLCLSTEEVSSKLEELVSQALPKLKKKKKDVLSKQEFVDLKENVEDGLRDLTSKKEALFQLSLRLEASTILLNNCTDLISSAGDVVKHIDQKLLRLEEKDKTNLHEIHDLIAIEKKWMVDARNIFSLDLMAIEDEEEMANKLQQKKKFQHAIPKHKTNLTKITEICEDLADKDVHGVEEVESICKQLVSESEEVVRLSEEQDVAFEKEMAEETSFYSQLEELYTWMEKAGDVLQSGQSIPYEDILKEFDEYSEKFANICQRSIEISKRRTSFDSQMTQIKSQWNDICCHLTRLQRSKNAKIIKDEQYQILASTQSLEKQLMNINEFMEKLDVIEAIDKEVQQQREEILDKKRELERAALLRDKLKKRYKEEVENVVISVEEYVIDVDDPDYEHVIEILYNNQCKLETVATSIEDMKNDGEKLKMTLPLDDYREFVECVTEVEEIFYEKQSDHAKMGLIVQVEKQFRGIDIILKGLTDLEMIEDLEERIAAVDENQRSLSRLSKELSTSLKHLEALGGEYYPLIVQSMLERIRATIPLIDLHLESLQRSSDDYREMFVNIMDGMKQTEDFLEHLNQTELFYAQEMDKVDCLYNTKVVLSTVSTAVKDHREALDKMFSYCNFFIEKCPGKKRRTLLGCLESCRNKTHELEDRVTIQDALLSKKLMILNGIEIQVHTIETAAQQASEMVSSKANFDVDGMERMLNDFQTTLQNISKENEIFLEELPVTDHKEITSLLARVKLLVDNLKTSLIVNGVITSSDNKPVQFIELQNIFASNVIIEYLPETQISETSSATKNASKIQVYCEEDCIEKEISNQESSIDESVVAEKMSVVAETENEIMNDNSHTEYPSNAPSSLADRTGQILSCVNDDDQDSMDSEKHQNAQNEDPSNNTLSEILSCDQNQTVTMKTRGPVIIKINGEQKDEEDDGSWEDLPSSEQSQDFDQELLRSQELDFSSLSTKDFDENKSTEELPTDVDIDAAEDSFDQLANDICRKSSEDNVVDNTEKVRLLKLALNKHLVVVSDLKHEIGQPLDQLEEMFEQNQRLSSIFHKHKTIYQLLCQHYWNEIADQLATVDTDSKIEIEQMIKEIHKDHIEFTELLEQNAKHLNECQDVKFEADHVLQTVQSTLDKVTSRLSDIELMDSLEQMKLAIDALQSELDSVREIVDSTDIDATKLTPFDFDYIEQEMISSNVNLSNLISNFHHVEMNCRDNIELKQKVNDNLEDLRKDISCLETTLVRYKSFNTGIGKGQIRLNIKSQYLELSSKAKDALAQSFESFPKVDRHEMQTKKSEIASKLEKLGNAAEGMDDGVTELASGEAESKSSDTSSQYSIRPTVENNEDDLVKPSVNVENTDKENQPPSEEMRIDENKNEVRNEKANNLEDKPRNNLEDSSEYASLFSSYEFGFTKSNDDQFDDDMRSVLSHGGEDVSSWFQDNNIHYLDDEDLGNESDIVDEKVSVLGQDFSLLGLLNELKSMDNDLKEYEHLSVVELKDLFERFQSRLVEIEVFLRDFEPDDSSFEEFSAVCMRKNIVNELLCDLEISLQDQYEKKQAHEKCLEDVLKQLQEIEEINDAQKLDVDLGERVQIVETHLTHLREIDEKVNYVFNEGTVFHLLPAVDKDQLERQFTMFAGRFNDMEERLNNQIQFLKQKLVLKEKFDKKLENLHEVYAKKLENVCEVFDKKLEDIGDVCDGDNFISELQLELSLFRGVLSSREQKSFDLKIERLRSVIESVTEENDSDSTAIKEPTFEIETHLVARESENPQLQGEPIMKAGNDSIKTNSIQFEPMMTNVETTPLQHKSTVKLEIDPIQQESSIEFENEEIDQQLEQNIKQESVFVGNDQSKPESTIEVEYNPNEFQPTINVENKGVQQQPVEQCPTQHESSIEVENNPNEKQLITELESNPNEPIIEVISAPTQQPQQKQQPLSIQQKPSYEMESHLSEKQEDEQDPTSSTSEQNKNRPPTLTNKKLFLKDDNDETCFSSDSLDQIADDEDKKGVENKNIIDDRAGDNGRKDVDEGQQVGEGKNINEDQTANGEKDERILLSLDQVKTFVLETLEKAVNKLNEYEKIDAESFDDVNDIIDALDALNMQATRNETANCQVLLTSFDGNLNEDEADDLQAEIANLLHCFEETSEEINKRSFDLRKSLILQVDYEEDLSRLSECLTRFRETNEKQEAGLSLNAMQKQLVKDKETLGSLQKELTGVKDQRVKLSDQLPEKVYNELVMMENEFQDELSAVASSLVKESSYLENLQASKRTLFLTILKQASAMENFKDHLSKNPESNNLERLRDGFDSLKCDWQSTKPVITASYKNLPVEDSKELQTYSDHLDEQLRGLETQLESHDLVYKLLNQKFLDWKDNFENLKSAWKDLNSEDYAKELEKQDQITRDIEARALELSLMDQDIDNLAGALGDEEFLLKVEDLKLSVENGSHEVKSLWIASKENQKHLEEGKQALDDWLTKYHVVNSEEEFNELKHSFEEIQPLLLSLHEAECKVMLDDLQRRIKEMSDKDSLQKKMKEKELSQLERVYKSTFNWLRTIRKSGSSINHNVSDIDGWLDEFTTTQSEFQNEKSDFDELILILVAETAPGFVEKAETLKKLFEEVQSTLTQTFTRLTQDILIRDQFLSNLDSFKKDLIKLETYLDSPNQEQEIGETLVMQSTLDQGFNGLMAALDGLSTKIPGVEFNKYLIQMESIKERVSESKQNVFNLYTKLKSSEESMVDIKATVEAAHQDIGEINGVIARVLDGAEVITPSLLTQTECRLLEVSLWVNSCVKEEELMNHELKQLFDSFNCAVENSKHLLNDLRDKIRLYDEFQAIIKTLESLVSLLADGSDSKTSYQDLNFKELLRELNEIGQQVECANLVEKQRENALLKIEEIKEKCSNLLENHNRVKLDQKQVILDSISEMKEFVLDVNENLPKDDETFESVSYLTDLLSDIRMYRDRTDEMLQKVIEHSVSILDDEGLLVQVNETKDSLTDLRDTTFNTEAKILQEISMGTLNQTRCEDVESEIARLSERQKILERSLESWEEQDTLRKILSFLKNHQETSNLLDKDISLLTSQCSSLRQNQSFNTELDHLFEKLESKQNIISTNLNELETISRKLLKNLEKIKCAQFQQVLDEHQNMSNVDLSFDPLHVQLRLTYAKLLRRKTKVLDLLESGTDVQKRIFASLPEVIDTLKKLECFEKDFEAVLQDLEMSLNGSQTDRLYETSIDDSFYMGDPLMEEEFTSETVDDKHHDQSFGLKWFKQDHDESSHTTSQLVDCEQIQSERFVDKKKDDQYNIPPHDENVFDHKSGLDERQQQRSKVTFFL